MTLDPDAPIRWRASWPDDPKTHETDGVAYAGGDQIGRAHYVPHVHTLHGTGWHWSVTDPRLQHGELKYMDEDREDERFSREA